MNNLKAFLKFSLIVLIINSCNYKEDGNLDFPEPLPPPVVKKQVEALVNGEKWEGTGRALYTQDSVVFMCQSENKDSLVIVVKSNKIGTYVVNNGSESYARFRSSKEYSTKQDHIGGTIEVVKIDTVAHSIDANFSFNATGSSGAVNIKGGSATSVMYLHVDCYIDGKYWVSLNNAEYPQLDISSAQILDAVSASNSEILIYNLIKDSLTDGKTIEFGPNSISAFYFPSIFGGDMLEAVKGKLFVKEVYVFDNKEYLDATFEFDFIAPSKPDTVRVRNGSIAVWKPILR